jgi:hypothetical protein
VGVLRGGIPGSPINFMYPEFVLEPFSQMANWQRHAEPLSVNVVHVPGATQPAPPTRRLNVKFRIPNSMFTAQSDKISFYAYRFSNDIRSDDIAFPPRIGKWNAGDTVELAIDVPTTFYSQPDRMLHFCVGTNAGCIPIPNLLGNEQPKC